MYLADALTTPVSLAGLPAVSVPCGFAKEGARELPVGLQLIAPALADARLFRVARAFELACGGFVRAPKLAGAEVRS
jgi:aspartyl-tRNA(Asn)/glutamyl-tRNA(Gln) amidotransferase subunit A